MIEANGIKQFLKIQAIQAPRFNAPRRTSGTGRTYPFRGEGAKGWNRRNPAVHHGIGEGRQPFPLRTLDGPRLAGVKIRKVEPELRRWAPGVELPAAGSLRCVARQSRDDDPRHCLGERGTIALNSHVSVNGDPSAASSGPPVAAQGPLWRRKNMS
jgi:hypothetical protein